MRAEPSADRGNDKVVLAAFFAGLAVYLALYFGTDPQRGQAWLMAFIPDQVLMSWIGGDVWRIGVLDRLFVVSMTAVTLLLGAGVGHLAISLTGGDKHLSPLETLVFSLAVGLSLLSVLTLSVGVAGLLRPPWVLRLLILAPAALGGWRWWSRGRISPNRDPDPLLPRGRVSPRRGASLEPPRDPDPLLPRGRVSPRRGASLAPPRDSDSLLRYGTWLALPFLVLILLGAMLPPWEFDVREYHLQVPKEWFLAGQIGFLPHNVYGNMPLGAEMQALLAMVAISGWGDWWWGALIGKTVMAAFVPLTAAALYATGRRLVSPTAGMAAALIFISTPWVVYVAMTGLNEGAVAAYSLLAVHAMLLWHARCREPGEDRPAQRGYLLLAGFLAGSAAACKYPALLFTVFPLFIWCLLDGGRLRWRSAALFLLAATCAVGPWYAKNAVVAGNPVYPLVFGGKTRTPERMEQWNRAHRVPVDERGRRYTPDGVADAAALVGWRSPLIQPLLIPLAALAWLAHRHRRLVAILVAMLGWVLVVWWLATHRVDRFLVPVLPWAAWLAGVGFVWSAQPAWRRIATGLLIAGLAYNFLYLVSSGSSAHYDRRLLVSLAELRRDEPREAGGPSRVSAAHRYLNQRLAPGQRVLLVGDAQPFDLEVPVLYNTCFDECQFERLMRGRNAQQRLQALQEERISHIYIDWSEIARYRSPGNYGYSDYVTRQVVWDELVREQGLLRHVPLDLEPQLGELFQVVPTGESKSYNE